MANNSIKIIVVDGGKDYNYNKKKTNVEDGEEKKKKTNSIFNIKKVIQNKIKSAVTPTGYLALQAGVSLAKQVIGSAANYYHSGIGLSSGDNNYQDIVNNHVQAIEDTVGFAGGIVSGVMVGGMVGGGAGAVIGGGVSALSSLINYGFKSAEVKRNFNFQMWKDGLSQSYGLARANYSIYNGRKI